MLPQVKLRASINKSMLNEGEQHLQLPRKGLSAQQITSSLEKRVGFPLSSHACLPQACWRSWLNFEREHIRLCA